MYSIFLRVLVLHYSGPIFADVGSNLLFVSVVTCQARRNTTVCIRLWVPALPDRTNAPCNRQFSFLVMAFLAAEVPIGTLLWHAAATTCSNTSTLNVLPRVDQGALLVHWYKLACLFDTACSRIDRL